MSKSLMYDYFAKRKKIIIQKISEHDATNFKVLNFQQFSRAIS